MKTLNVPLFIIGISIIIGIILRFYCPINPHYLYWIFGILFIGFVCTFIQAKQRLFQNSNFALISIFVFIGIGYACTYLHQPEQQKLHYLHHLPEKERIYQVSIDEELKPTPYQNNYLAEILAINKQPVQGKILISIAKDSCKTKEIYTKDRLLVYGKLTDIYEPLNPHQFNYRKYMQRKLVFKQLVTNWEEIKIIPETSTPILNFAYGFHDNVRSSLLKSNFSLTQIALIESMCLGQKQNLDKDVYTYFADAGIVHILAVSGLHVGIILYFLTLLFKPLKRLGIHQNLLGIFIILFLWGYAFLAGFSPSVLRAVTMFSFLSFGLFFKRKQNALNMLILSAIVLLFFNPYFIFDVGFQLSYSAVFAIVLFQPKLYSIFQFKYKIIDYLWKIISVTLIAQLGVLPLSLYYFHQFPLSFIFTNLLIVPLLGIILGLGFLVIILSLFNILPDLLVIAYGEILQSILYISEWFALREGWKIEFIYFSFTMLLLAYLVELSLVVLLYTKKKVSLLMFLISIISFQAYYIYTHWQKRHENKFFVFHKSRHTLLGNKEQNKLNLEIDSSLDSTKVTKSNLLKSIYTYEAIQSTKTTEKIESVYFIKEKTLLVIDSLGVYHLPKLKPDYILLKDSPKINLERLLITLKPQQIIADGSNYKSFVKQWEATCEQKKIPFYYTGKKGAFVIFY